MFGISKSSCWKKLRRKIFLLRTFSLVNKWMFTGMRNCLMLGCSRPKLHFLMVGMLKNSDSVCNFMHQHCFCAARTHMTTRHHLVNVEELAALIKYRPDPLPATTLGVNWITQTRREETMACLGATGTGHFTATYRQQIHIIANPPPPMNHGEVPRQRHQSSYVRLFWCMTQV